MVLNEVIERRPAQWVSAYEIAIVYCWLGDKDSAFVGSNKLNVSTPLASPSCASIPDWKGCDPIRDSNPCCEALTAPFREAN